MRFPDFIYAPSQFDVAKDIVLPQRVGQSGRVQTAGSAIHTIRFGPVPGDRVLIVTVATISAQAAGAELVNRLLVEILDQTEQVLIADLARVFPAAIRGVATFSGEAIAMPGEFLNLRADYSAAVEAKNTILSYTGYLIARANFQHSSLIQREV